MDEIIVTMQQMLGHAFEQGAAYQRMTDARDEFEHQGAHVGQLWGQLREMLAPPEGEQVQ